MKLENIQDKLYSDVCHLIDEAMSYLAQTANKTLTVHYWKIGQRINVDLLDGKRAGYSKQIVSQLATKLQVDYGKRGFEERNIRRMMQFTSAIPDFQIVTQAATQLSWSHFIELLRSKDELKRKMFMNNEAENNA